MPAVPSSRAALSTSWKNVRILARFGSSLHCSGGEVPALDIHHPGIPGGPVQLFFPPAASPVLQLPGCFGGKRVGPLLPENGTPGGGRSGSGLFGRCSGGRRGHTTRLAAACKGQDQQSRQQPLGRFHLHRSFLRQSSSLPSVYHFQGGKATGNKTAYFRWAAVYTRNRSSC